MLLITNTTTQNVILCIKQRKEKKHIIYYTGSFVGGGCRKIKHNMSTKKAGAVCKWMVHFEYVIPGTVNNKLR
jgi:hypothetical protein